MTWKKGTAIVIAVLVLALLAAPRGAQADLIVNGGFEGTANVTPPNYPGGAPGVPGSGGIGQIDYNTMVTGWSSPDASYANQTGYNFIFSPATSSSTGSNGYNGGIALWGPGNGFNNGLTASPVGGQFVGADGDTRYHGRIQQAVNDLTPGQTYQLGFWWALAQQSGGGGTPFGQWDVTFGSETHSTPAVQLPAPGGFVPWMHQVFNFTATNGSEVLSFLATEGGPFGGPPFLLLDGVTLNPAAAAVPEPSTLLLVGAGLFGLGVVRRLRRRGGAAAA